MAKSPKAKRKKPPRLSSSCRIHRRKAPDSSKGSAPATFTNHEPGVAVLVRSEWSHQSGIISLLIASC